MNIYINNINYNDIAMYSNVFKVNNTVIFMKYVKSISVEKRNPTVYNDKKYVMTVYFINDDKPITEAINEKQKLKLNEFLRLDSVEDLNIDSDNFNIF